MFRCSLNHLPSLLVKERSRKDDERTGAPLRRRPECALNLTRTPDLQQSHLSIQEHSRRLCLFPITLAVRVRTSENGYTRGAGSELRD
jgi:hypothetical protein